MGEGKKKTFIDQFFEENLWVLNDRSKYKLSITNGRLIITKDNGLTTVEKIPLDDITGFEFTGQSPEESNQFYIFFKEYYTYPTEESILLWKYKTFRKVEKEFKMRIY